MRGKRRMNETAMRCNAKNIFTNMVIFFERTEMIKKQRSFCFILIVNPLIL